MILGKAGETSGNGRLAYTGHAKSLRWERVRARARRITHRQLKTEAPGAMARRILTSQAGQPCSSSYGGPEISAVANQATIDAGIPDTHQRLRRVRGYLGSF